MPMPQEGGKGIYHHPHHHQCIIIIIIIITLLLLLLLASFSCFAAAAAALLFRRVRHILWCRLEHMQSWLPPFNHPLTHSQSVGRSVGRYDATKSVANAAALHCTALHILTKRYIVLFKRACTANQKNWRTDEESPWAAIGIFRKKTKIIAID